MWWATGEKYQRTSLIVRPRGLEDTFLPACGQRTRAQRHLVPSSRSSNDAVLVQHCGRDGATAAMVQYACSAGVLPSAGSGSSYRRDARRAGATPMTGRQAHSARLARDRWRSCAGAAGPLTPAVAGRCLGSVLGASNMSALHPQARCGLTPVAAALERHPCEPVGGLVRRGARSSLGSELHSADVAASPVWVRALFRDCVQLASV